jgi:hypothetical protein
MRWHRFPLLTVCATVLVAGSLGAVVPSSAATAGTVGSPAATAGQPVYAFNSGLVLTVGAKPARGAAVKIAANKDTAGQLWLVSQGTVRPAADQKLCLNVPDANFRAGVKLQLWSCNGHAGEHFGTKAPSAHTAVFFLRPAARTRYCVNAAAESGALVGLESCTAAGTQAWSHTNLAGVAGTIGQAFTIQALHPTTAGSAVTGSSHFASKLDQFWTSATSGNYLLLHPVADSALCAAPASSQRDGVPLVVVSCDGSASQRFTGIGLIFNLYYTAGYIATADSAYCVQAAAAGPVSTRPILLGPCVGNDRDLWYTTLNMTSNASYQYQELYVGTGPLQFSIRVTGNGGAGSEVRLSSDDQAAGQVWTDLAPGQTKATGNPDGSITLRPLSDEDLCLTVPGADYKAGMPLTVEACDGKVDQEFVRGFQAGPTDLVAAGRGEFCVAASGGIVAGGPVELEPCADQDSLTWSTFFDWYAWAGVQLSPVLSDAYPADSLILSGAGASGGQVDVAASPGAGGWYPSQDWIYAQSPSGDEIESVYYPGLCLDAPAASVGTQLTAAPCTSSAGELFFFGHSDTAYYNTWQLGINGPCVAVSSTAGSAGLPLVLQACSASDTSEAWFGPPAQL